MRWSKLVLTLVFAVAAFPTLSSASSAGPTRGVACNLRGSWVANTAVTSAYFQALNPTTGDIQVTSGALVATFAGGRFNLGSIDLHLVGHKGRTTIKEQVDLDSTAPYTVHGARIVLGPGSYKLVHIRVVLTTAGHSKEVHLPTTSLATGRSSMGYSCTPSVLNLHVQVGTRTVTLTMRRQHG